jgi:hypothetical protein
MKNKKWIVAGVLVLVVIYIGFNAWFFVQNLSQKLREQGLGIPAKLTERYSNLGKFTIMVPETWSAIDTPQGNNGHENVIFSISNFSRSVYAQISSYTSADSLDSFTQSEIETLKSSDTGYRLINLQEYSPHQNLGNSHEYLMMKGPAVTKSEFHCLDWYTIHQSGYSFSFCVASPNWDAAKNNIFEMINSIKFQ